MTPRESINAAKARVRHIQIETGKEFRIGLEQLMSIRRDKSITEARMAAIWLSKEMTSLSLPEIGRLFEKDRTTIMHSIMTIGKRLKWDDELFARLEAISARIEQGNETQVGTRMIEVLADIIVAAVEDKLLNNPDFRSGLINVLTKDQNRRDQLQRVFALKEVR